MKNKIPAQLLLLVVSFIPVFFLLLLGKSLGNEILLKSGIFLIPVVLILFILVLFILPRIKSKKAFEKFVKDNNLDVSEKPVLPDSLTNIFSRTSPYKQDVRNILQKVRNLVTTRENINIFSNTQIVYRGSSGGNQAQEHLCFLFEISNEQFDYHIITLDDRPYANDLYNGITSLITNMAGTDNFIVKSGISEIDDKYMISSKNKKEIDEIVLLVKNALINIKNAYADFSIPRSAIDYRDSNMVIDITNRYCLIRMDINYLVYIEKIYPLIVDLKNLLKK